MENGEGCELSPVTALRVIDAILSDRSLTSTQQKVIVAVVLRADNKTGIAWLGYGKLHTTYRVTGKTVSAALRAAQGRYLRVAKRGRNNSVAYQVLAVPPGNNETAGCSLGEQQYFPRGTTGCSLGEHILAPVSSPTLSPQGAGELLSKAHKEAFGSPMPSFWCKDLAKPAKQGPLDFLEGVDAGFLRKAEAWRKESGWRNDLSPDLLERYAAKVGRRASPTEATDADRRREALAAEVRQRDAEVAEKSKARVEIFRSQPATVQSAILAEARSRFKFPAPDSAVEASAALLFEARPVAG